MGARGIGAAAAADAAALDATWEAAPTLAAASAPAAIRVPDPGREVV